MSVVVSCVGNVCCVAGVVKFSVSIGAEKYVVCLCSGCDGCCLLCLNCASVLGNVTVLSCRYIMFVFCVHAVAVLNAALCMSCSLLMLVKDAKRPPYGRGILQRRSHDCLVGSHGCLLLFATCCCIECFFLFVEVCIDML